MSDTMTATEVRARNLAFYLGLDWEDLSEYKRQKMCDYLRGEDLHQYPMLRQTWFEKFRFSVAMKLIGNLYPHLLAGKK